MTAPRRLTGTIPPARFRSPARKEGTLVRERISGAMERSLDDRHFVVVSAPSGFGKTTAVADWAATQPTLAWLMLNPLDSDPAHLTRGILDALGRGYRQAGRPLPELGEYADPRCAYSSLLRAIDATGVEMQLVVDDAHHAGEDWRRGLLGMLADEPPEQLKVVLAGTTLLDLTLTRERLLEPALFITADELRFTEDEVDHLSRRTGASIDTSAVLRETQGWPIAVRMVMIGGREPTSTATTATAFLGDYVRDHILGALDPELAEFVLAATVCTEVTPELARAITGKAESAALLEDCVRLGLFVDRFSTPAGVVYRWHGAFVRTCSEIRRADPKGTAALHRSAAAHLESFDPLRSVEHSLRAGDPATARDTVMKCWVSLVMNGSGSKVESAASMLLRADPEDVEMRFVLACATDVLGDHHLAVQMMQRAEAVATPAASGRVTADIARLFICDDPTKVQDALVRLGREVSSSDGTRFEHHAAINILLGWAELRNPGNPALPAEYFAAAARELVDVDPAGWHRALGHLAFGLTWAGRFTDAASTVERLRGSGWSHHGADHAFASASAGAAAGYVAYWAGDSQRSADEFRSVLAQGVHDPSFAAIGRMMIAYSVAESADPAAARRAAIGIQDIPVETLHGVHWQIIRESAIAALEECAGNHERAVRLARANGHCAELPIVVVAMSGVLRRAGEYSESLKMLRSLRVFSEVSYVKAATLITAAVARRAAGDHARAHDLCEAALSVAAKESIRILFSPREAAVRRLLSEHIHFGTQFEDLISECLASQNRGSRLDALSERERAVFQQLQTSRTLPEIAEALDLSINTVKTHQRSIYRKLEVGSRRDAVRSTV